MSYLCSCGHTSNVHLQQRRRCQVPRCPCVLPRFRQVQSAEPAPRKRGTATGDGILLTLEKQDATPAQKIWRESDRKKLENRLWRSLELAGLPLPDQLEYHFAKSIGRNYRADGFYRPRREADGAGWLIEVDGGIWRPGGGAHSHPLNLEAQHERDNLAVLLGYRCLRFTGRQIDDGSAVKTIGRALQPAERML